MSELRDQFIELLRITKREGIDEVIGFLCTSDFFTAPASTRYHSCHEGGLAEHSFNVYKALKEKLSKNHLFGEVKEDSIIISALLHDICKTNFYISEPKNKKVYSQDGMKSDSNGRFDWVSYMGYTVDDKSPLGHGEKSVIMLMQYIKLTKEEMYAIRWHMGGFEAKENYNALSETFKRYPLALALHEADLEATYLLESEE